MTSSGIEPTVNTKRNIWKETELDKPFGQNDREKYRHTFYSTNRKEIETKEDLGRNGMSALY
jgi:hypothetical protein